MNTQKNKSAWDIFEDKGVVVELPQTYLSFEDLKLLPEFRLCLMRQDLETFERILYENGLDVSKGYNVVMCTHRQRTCNNVVTAFRVEARERTDASWINSGAASEDAFFHSLGQDMLNELIALDPHKSRVKKEWMEDRELGIDFDVEAY